MSKANLWFQGLDFDVAERGTLGSDEVLSAFDEQPWSEIIDQWRQSPSPDDECPPGLGLDRVDKAELRLFLLSPESSQFSALISLDEPAKLFGFIPSSKTLTWNLSDLSAEQARQLLKDFVDTDRSALLPWAQSF
jgi:hypothetical protein